MIWNFSCISLLKWSVLTIYATKSRELEMGNKGTLVTILLMSLCYKMKLEGKGLFLHAL